MNKILKRIALTGALMLCGISSQAQSWKKVYANDENGMAVMGSKKKLIKAIEEGAEVRVMLVYPSHPGQEYFTPAENIWVKNGEVTIQNISQVSVNDDYTFQYDPYYWMIMVNTQGELEATRWLVGEHTTKGRNKQKASVTWFVR